MDTNLIMNRNDILLIKVHSYEGKLLAGTLYDPYRNRFHRFENMTQLIMKVDQVLNDQDVELASKQDIFESARKEGRFELIPGDKPWLMERQKVIATFKLQVCFRKFGTWQGMLWSIDTAKAADFRSVLELTMLMDYELENAAVSSTLNEEAE